MIASQNNSLMLALYEIWNIPAQRGLLLLYLFLIIVALVPVAIVTYVPGVDMPVHVLIAVIHAIGTSGYFSADWVPSPYILFYGAMYPFIHLFGYLIATKILVMLYVILFPIAILIFFLEFNPRQWYLAFFTFPFIYNYHFEYGFFPYCFGIPLVFIGLVVGKKALNIKPSSSNIFLAVMFSTLVYLSHIDNLIAFSLGMLCLVTSKIWHHRNDEKYLATAILYVSKLTIIFLPIIILSLSYLIYLKSHYGSKSSVMAMGYGSLFNQFIGALRFPFSLDDVSSFLTVGIIISMLGWIFIRERARFSFDFPLIFGILMILCAFIIPRENFLGSWDHSSRFMIFGVIGTLASIRSTHVRMARMISIMAAILFIINIGLRTDFYLKADNIASQFIYTLNKYIPPNQKIYTVYSSFPNARVPSLMHLISYYHIDKGGYSPDLFSQESHVNGMQSSIKLPGLINIWDNNIDDQHLNTFKRILSQYDYLVISTFDASLPQYFANEFYSKIIYQDILCTIIKLH